MQGMDSSFEDWGLHIRFRRPVVHFHHDARRPLRYAPLNTTITRLAVRHVTLASASSAPSAAHRVARHGPNLKLACQSGAALCIPNGGFIRFNSILDLASCIFSKLLVAGTDYQRSCSQKQHHIEGYPLLARFSSIDTAQRQGPSVTRYFCSRRFGRLHTFKNLPCAASRTYQSCMFYDQDNNGNNVSAQSFGK